MIELRNLTIRSGPFVLADMSLIVPQGRYAALMGATGQGKTTVLEAICGLRSVAGGQVLIHGVDVTGWAPGDRGIGFVPQDLALFPTLTVRGHLEFALQIRRAGRTKIRERVAALAHVLGIEPLLDRGIRHLSGGEARRVALGRALAFEPQVLLLDEPLTALDEATRQRLGALLRQIQHDNGLTTLHITHSRGEAQALADTLFVMEARRIVERPLAALATEAAHSVEEDVVNGRQPATATVRSPWP